MFDIVLWIAVVVIIIYTIYYTLSCYKKLKKETIKRIKEHKSQCIGIKRQIMNFEEYQEWKKQALSKKLP